MRGNNIILTGLSGSGKTTLGKTLSQKLNFEFIDLDEHIVSREKMAIPEIFEIRGEDGFRRLEAEAVRSLEGKSGCVISTGGGAVLRQENVRMLYDLGPIIFIDRPPEQIAGDIDTEGRPLLKKGAGEIFELSGRRRDIYLKTADRILHNGRDREAALQELFELAAFASGGETHLVIGDPISHSKSPELYNGVFKERGTGFRYGCMRVPKERLADFVSWARDSVIEGFNVTIPHKRDIIPLLDEISREAGLCGAVNTVVRRDGKLVGYNTDMGGLSAAVTKAGHSFKDNQAVILGAGGAARAAAVTAALEGASAVRVLARDAEKSRSLASDISRSFGTEALWGDMNAESLEEHVQNGDILINSTPLGMHGTGTDFESLAFVEKFSREGLIFDMVYNPPETELLKMGRGLGIDCINGMEMLTGQALLAQELYVENASPGQTV